MRANLLTTLRSLVFFSTLTIGLGATRILCAQSAPQDGNESSATIDLATYESELTHDAGFIDTNRHAPQKIAGLRKSIPESWRVRTPDSDLNISNEWLRAELWNIEHRPKEADAIAARLKQHLLAMSASAGAMETASAEPSAAKAQLDKVFSRREFRGLSGPSDFQLWMARMEDWILRWMERLLNRLHINAKAGNAVAWCVIGLAFAFLCYWIWKRLRIDAEPFKASGVAQEVGARTSREWLDDALSAAERGDYREAIHCAYWAAITRLEDSGALKRDRARTPREALRQLDSQSSGQTPLRDLTRHFEVIWYGYRPASASDWSGARAQLEQMGCLRASTAPTANS